MAFNAGRCTLTWQHEPGVLEVRLSQTRKQNPCTAGSLSLWLSTSRPQGARLECLNTLGFIMEHLPPFWNSSFYPGFLRTQCPICIPGSQDKKTYRRTGLKKELLLPVHSVETSGPGARACGRGARTGLIAAAREDSDDGNRHRWWHRTAGQTWAKKDNFRLSRSAGRCEHACGV